MKFSELEQPLRYTYQYKQCANGNDNCEEINGYAVITHLDDTYLEADNAKKLALCDVSYLPRMGIKKYSYDNEIEKSLRNIPGNVNCAINNNGCLIVRLGVDELLLLDTVSCQFDLQNTIMKHHYNEGYTGPSYFVPRHETHCCLVLTGSNASNLLAKLCAVDLRDKAFPNLQVAQTSIARISSIIIKSNLSNYCCFYILVDQAYHQYIWDCITDAMQEFTGSIIGVDSLKLLNQP